MNLWNRLLIGLGNWTFNPGNASSNLVGSTKQKGIVLFITACEKERQRIRRQVEPSGDVYIYRISDVRMGQRADVVIVTEWARQIYSEQRTYEALQHWRCCLKPEGTWIEL